MIEYTNSNSEQFEKILQKYDPIIEEFFKIESLYYEELKNNPSLITKYESFNDFYSAESAFTKNPSLIRNAFIRLCMAFRFNKETSLAQYMESFERLDVDVIKQSTTSTLFDLSSIEAFDEVMKIFEVFSNCNITDSMVKHAVEMFKDRLNNFETQLIFIFIGLGIPFVNMVAFIYFIFKVQSMTSEASDLNSQYGEQLTNILFDHLKKAGIERIIPGLNLNNKMEALRKMSSYINRIRNTMFPNKIKRSIKPNFLNRSCIMTYEDKVKAVTLIKDNFRHYQTTLLKNPRMFINSVKSIMIGSELENQVMYGISSGSDPLTKGFGDLLTSVMITLFETNFYVINLVSDLKRY